MKLYATHLDDILDHDSAGFCTLPGARELVEALHRTADVLLGLATGNMEPTAYLKLRAAKLDGFFDFGGFGSDSSARSMISAAPRSLR